MLNKLKAKRAFYEDEIKKEESRIEACQNAIAERKRKIAILDEIIAEDEEPHFRAVADEKPSEETIVLLCHGAKDNSEA
jgi:hypothetical protein